MKNIENTNWEKEFIEKGADLEHDRWSRWHRYFRLMATPRNIEMWDDKAEKPYIVLTDKEQESDREETRKYLPLINSLLSSERQRLRKKVKRIKLEVDTVICDCGLPYKESDLADLISELLKLLED